MVKNQQSDFCDVLAELADGEVRERLTRRLAEIIAAVEATGKSGELTVRMSVKTEGDRIRVGALVKARLPEMPIAGSLFYSDGSGGLHRDNPGQIKMFGGDS